MTNPLTDAQIDELLVGTKYAPPYEVWVEDKTLPEGGYWQTTESEFRLEVDARLNAARVIQLEAELTQLRAENEWHPVTKCPYGEIVLLGRITGAGGVLSGSRIDEDLFIATNMERYVEPTHYRLLPTPPQAKEGE